MSKFKRCPRPISKAELVVIVSALIVAVISLLLANFVKDVTISVVARYVFGIALLPIIFVGMEGKAHKYHKGKLRAIRNPFQPRIY